MKRIVKKCSLTILGAFSSECYFDTWSTRKQYATLLICKTNNHFSFCKKTAIIAKQILLKIIKKKLHTTNMSLYALHYQFTLKPQYNNNTQTVCVEITKSINLLKQLLTKKNYKSFFFNLNKLKICSDILKFYSNTHV